MARSLGSFRGFFLSLDNDKMNTRKDIVPLPCCVSWVRFVIFVVHRTSGHPLHDCRGSIADDGTSIESRLKPLPLVAALFRALGIHRDKWSRDHGERSAPEFSQRGAWWSSPFALSRMRVAGKLGLDRYVGDCRRVIDAWAWGIGSKSRLVGGWGLLVRPTIGCGARRQRLLKNSGRSLPAVAARNRGYLLSTIYRAATAGSDHRSDFFSTLWQPAADCHTGYCLLATS